MRLTIPLSALLLPGAATASELPETPVCASVAEPWATPREALAGSDAAEAADAGFAVNEALRFALHPDGDVAYLTLPQGAGEAESFGGLASFSVDRAGVYSVGLSEPIWVDVVRDGKPVEAVHFGPAPACSGIRKAVAFELAAGRHVLELSGSTVPEVGVTITQVP